MKERYVIKSMVYDGYWDEGLDNWNTYNDATIYKTVFDALLTIETHVKEDCEIVKIYVS